MASGGDKTEKATPKKRDDARKKGQVARSVDLNGAAVLMAGLLALSAFAPGMVDRMEEAMRSALVLVAAVQVCAPVLLAVVITDAAVGVVSRVMPQLNVFAVGFPAKMVVGLLLIGASLPFGGGWMRDELQHSVAAALDALEVSG